MGLSGLAHELMAGLWIAKNFALRFCYTNGGGLDFLLVITEFAYISHHMFETSGHVTLLLEELSVNIRYDCTDQGYLRRSGHISNKSEMKQKKPRKACIFLHPALWT